MKYISIILSTIAIGLCIYLLATRPKSAFVDINKVYNEFDMKNELAQKYDAVKMQRKNILDSLLIKVQLLSKQMENQKKPGKELTDQYNALRNEYYLKEKQFIEDNEMLSQQYNEQIFKQLNQYIQDYGREKRYAFVFGAKGDGSLMHASDKNNISDKVIVYVNEKYAGK